MAEQTIISIQEYSNFLQSGSLLMLDPETVKLILGPFKPITDDFDLETSNLGNKTIIFKPDFWDFLENKKYLGQLWFGSKEYILKRVEFLKLVSSWNRLNKVKAYQGQWQEEDKDLFKQQFDWSQQQFNLGTLSKTVPITKKTSSVGFSENHLSSSLENLLRQDNYGHIYGFWQEGEGFLGLTPELIGQWDLNQKTVQTMALAGTQKNNLNVEYEMLKDQKLTKEHQFVVEDIEAVLAKFDLSYKKSEVSVLKLSSFSHLITPISTVADNLKDAFKICSELHPTAALGIFPRDLNMYQSFSKFNLQQERKNFAAPFGYFSNNTLCIVVAIRNFFFSSKSVSIFSGCGIISESNFQTEMEELRQKRDAVKVMMGFQ